MQKIKHINHFSILKGMGIGLLFGASIFLLSAYIKIPVSIPDLAVLLSIPVVFGAFAGYTIS
ncbi:MAG: hypothetical protein WC901_06535 [Candidatus Margulisiibacteriota bacterium]